MAMIHGGNRLGGLREVSGHLHAYQTVQIRQWGRRSEYQVLIFLAKPMYRQTLNRIEPQQRYKRTYTTSLCATKHYGMLILIPKTTSRKKFYNFLLTLPFLKPPKVKLRLFCFGIHHIRQMEGVQFFSIKK